MLQAKKIRDLDITTPSDPNRPAFISAASGLVRFKDWLYIVADDELSLFAFTLNPNEPGIPYLLLPGQLPLDYSLRKKKKPDYESLVLMPAKSNFGHAALLVLPSGSTKNRMMGVCVQLNLDGSPAESKNSVNFAPLYDCLLEKFPSLNIEGAVVSGNYLKLFQRGNAANSKNAVIDLDLNQVLVELKEGQLSANTIKAVTSYDLGELNGIKLSFTDAAPLENNFILFVAAAEDTNDTYNDGRCEGSVLGIIDQAGKIVFSEEISPTLKAEGVSATVIEGQVEVLFVIDDDNPTKASELYSCNFFWC